jgi:acetoin utilization deacetylase AcuC-like enzyme
MEGIRNIKKHFPDHLTVIEDFAKAPRDVLLMVHDEAYITKMESQKIESDTPQHATQFSVDDTRVTQDQDTFMSLFSFEAALKAAGAVCKAIDLVTEGRFRNAFCCVRPPGHHCGIKGHTAEASSQGYCIINNISVGAMYATRILDYKKVAVVDFDVRTCFLLV